jgi:hypothetical protein
MVKPASCSNKPLFFVLLILAFVASSAQEPPKNRVTPQQLRIVQYNGRLAHFLATLADEYGIVIGFETDSQLPETVKFEARNVTFHQLLDAIVLAEPRYRWREVNGAIEFYPAVGVRPVLDTVIKSFELKDGHFDEAAEGLMNLPEVQYCIAAMALTRREVAPRFPRAGAPFSLRLEQLTVRQSMHEIAKKSEIYFWMYYQSNEKERPFSLRSQP